MKKNSSQTSRDQGRRVSCLWGWTLGTLCFIATHPTARAQDFPAFPSSAEASGLRNTANHSASNKNDRFSDTLSSGQHSRQPSASHNVPDSAWTRNSSTDQWATDQAAVFSSSSRSQVVTASAEQPVLGSNRPAQTPLQPPSPSHQHTKPQSSSSLRMFTSVASSLLIVLGIFVGCVWLYRKSVGNSVRSGLPNNVVQVLGRTPVAPRQNLVLLRFGSKLVLVSMVQGETRAISEITDPLEVDQLAGLCETNRSGSMTASFREILAQGGRA